MDADLPNCEETGARAALISAIALDLGSTSVKAGLLQSDGTLHDVVSCPAPEVLVKGERYESDALAYVAAAQQVLAQCLARTEVLPPLALCSQRSSFLIWERTSGQPVTPLISWQDTRGAASCALLQAQEARISALSGLRLTPYYFAPKLQVLLQSNPHWRECLERGEYLVGTLDTFLIWHWTGGRHFVTDASMAARTLLFDIYQQRWSPELCALFDIPLAVLPQIIPSCGAGIRLDNGLLLQVCVADQSAAFYAAAGGEGQAALVNLGTGGFVMRAAPAEDLSGYLRTLLYQNADGTAHLALEGTLNSIAAALAPYPVADCQVEDLALSDIFCLAEPSGVGAPYFRGDLGLQFSASVSHLSARQTGALLLEAIVFRVTRILEELHRASAIERVYLSGGLSSLPALRYGIARCAPAAVYLLRQPDASLQGAAWLAAGRPSGGDSAAERISVAHTDARLPEKYRQWCNWFDALMAKPVRR